MTTVIIDGKSEAVYTDSRATSGNSVVISDSCCKSFPVRSKEEIIVGTGIYRNILKAATRRKEGKKLPKLRKSTMVVITDRTYFFFIEKYSNGKWVSITIGKDEYACFGSGMDFARGAMEVCHDPERAMEAAKNLDPASGGDTIKIPFSYAARFCDYFE